MRAGQSSFPSASVIDASVLIKVFLPEEGSEIATALIQRSEGNPTVHAVPDLAYLECANILWKWVRRGMLSAELARQSGLDLRVLPLQVWPSQDLIAPALEIALSHDVTVYDAAYLALAQALNIPFITADEALVRKIGGPNEQIRPLFSFDPGSL